jgi:coenzyme PQQ precursor peptide PqqA
MATQKPAQKPQNNSTDAQTEQRLPIRISEDWEKPSIEELDLCLEVTAYIYHWQ